ncbi:hypothetical protein [Methylocucumis oryzae]|uniref:hypothetical protein n=1 Tax=Methylocucumis oryzae TaxID=1632867 RepID=UPI000ABBF199
MKIEFNKSLNTNLISVAFIILGVITSSQLIKSIGFFALSGAITNWLAIHMLFEKKCRIYTAQA